jgi:hypothetical protein
MFLNRPLPAIHSGGNHRTPRFLRPALLFACCFLNSPTFAAPIQYILFNGPGGPATQQSNPESLGPKAFEEVLAQFPNRPADAPVQTGVSHAFSVFQTSPETTVRALRAFLAAAEQTGTPVVVQLDTEQWWGARPDLWNWSDETKPGYDPANRENVEWTGWSPDQAIKIAWRNWGRQVRVLPPPNFASPRYIEAYREELQRLIPIIMDWQAKLPEEKKHFFIGIKLGWETSIGFGSYYYPGDNDLLNKPEADDPVTRHAAEGPDASSGGKSVLTRGCQQIGYAAVKTSGLRTSGDITETDLRDVCQRYLATLCEEAAKLGVPREVGPNQILR